jgi:hypothetical protein
VAPTTTTTSTTASPTTSTTPAPTTTTTTTAAPTCPGIEPGTAQCARNEDCPSGRTCINGGCFAACPTLGARCDTGTPCPGCFCDPPTEGGGQFCGDFNFVIGTCQNSAGCPPGSFCIAEEGRCARPCPTLQ